MNYMKLEVDTNKVEEVPAKEPRYNAQPVKSALKKMRNGGGEGSSGPSTPTLENKSLGVKHEQHSK
jgi:phosphatase and actin regulator 4